MKLSAQQRAALEATQALERELGRPPTATELAARLGLETLCAQLEISMSYDDRGLQVDRDINPPWEHHAYSVKVRRGAESFETTYKQGLAHTDGPSLVAVLACLMSDASAGKGGSFEDFCGEYGYDTDSRRAESAYNACRDTAAAMRRMLGEHFDAVAAAAQEH